jgi:flagellar basal-body rod modification protein FlgD
MSVSSINSTTGAAAAATNPTAALTGGKTLTQDDFLKLLVAQLSAQDPMNPQSNTEFAAQMAQFSALQTSQGTEANMSKLLSAQQMTQANSLIGRSVTLLATDGSVATGAVTAVQMNSGTPQILVNGTPYDLSQVLSIQPPS